MTNSTDQEREAFALIPVERSYDMRAAAILHFNTARQAGDDLDDALDKAWRATLSKAHYPDPDPDRAQQPASVAVPDKMSGAVGFAKGIQDGWNAAIDAVLKLNAAPHPASGNQVDGISHAPDAQNVTGLVELLQQVRLGEGEAARHGAGFSYWNNAVLACQIAIRDAIAPYRARQGEQP